MESFQSKPTAGAAVVVLTLAWAQYDSRLAVLARFALFCLAAFSLRALYMASIYPYYVSGLRHLPQPSGNHWLLGQSKRIWTEPLGGPMRDWIKNVPNDGLIRYLSVFNQERLIVCSPKALAEVLVTKSYEFAKPPQLRWSIGRIVGVGLLLSDGHEHKAQRRMLLPAFSFRHIKDLYPVFWQKAREMALVMTDEFEGQSEVTVDISPYASRVTLDIIGLAGMGRDFGAIQDPENPLVQTYDKIFRPSRSDEAMSIIGRLIPFRLLAMLPVKRNRFIKHASADLRAVCRDLIREKREAFMSDEPQGVDILSVALRNTELTDDGLIEDQLMTFLAAGHETTASALIWAIYLLCRHTDVQTQLRKEVRQNLPLVQSETDIVSEDIDRLPYLNAVCSEVLRYYGPLPLTSRHAAHDTTIQGQPVPKGTRVVIVPWATNFDPKLWGPDADQFRPERWLSADGATKDASGGATSNFAMLSFSHGPRSCIGQRFSRAEFACLLATWISEFEFALADPTLMDENRIKIRRGITVRPHELRVKIKVVQDDQE